MTPQQLNAMKLALEALEGFYEYGYDRQECFEHITAIKEALLEHAMQEVQRLGQEIEQEPVAPPWWPAVENILTEYGLQAIDFVADFKNALAQTQEPVSDDIASILACRNMLDAQPVPPRTWIGNGDLEDSNAYLTPPQRKPLTNGEIYTAYIAATNQTLRATDERLAFAFARAIEAAHGIKGDA
jgi:HPt (histidine-containing phosphotransfer) domain-containing protein